MYITGVLFTLQSQEFSMNTLRLNLMMALVMSMFIAGHLLYLLILTTYFLSDFSIFSNMTGLYTIE